MTLAELIARYRFLVDDRVGPDYFVKDEDLIPLFNEAEMQAAICGRLLHESANPAVCEIAVVSGTSFYTLHASLYELDYVGFQAEGDDRIYPVRLVSQEWLDKNLSEWRTRTDTPGYAIQSDTGLRLTPRPNVNGTLQLEGYRKPMAPMVDLTDTPEINAIHHLRLVDWVAYRVFSIPDSELLNPAKSASALASFIDYFGPLPDSDLGRQTREDFPHVVEGFLP